jgi:hypothetical protein
MSDARIRHVPIAVPLARAYAVASPPAFFARWVAGLARALREEDGRWLADTPEGVAEVAFTPDNPQGVLDHRVRLPGRLEVYVPLRLVADRAGTLAELVLFRQPGMSDADFDRDTALVERDLATLKRVLETGA